MRCGVCAWSSVIESLLRTRLAEQEGVGKLAELGDL